MYNKTVSTEKNNRTSNSTKSKGLYSLPSGEAGIELAKIYHIVSNEAGSSAARGLSGSDKVGNIADAIGSLGMILGAVKMPSGEQNTFTLSVLNTSEHVMVPYRFRCNTGLYTTSNFDVIAPNQNSDLNFNINNAFNGDLDLYLDFVLCAKNEKSLNASLHITKGSNGEIAPYSLTVEYRPESIKFDRSQQGTKDTNTLLYAASDSPDELPSFGAAIMGTYLNSHSMGISITPWRPV